MLYYEKMNVRFDACKPIVRDQDKTVNLKNSITRHLKKMY